MKIIATCGHEYSGLQAIDQILLAAGMAPALPSNKDQRTFAQFHEQVVQLSGHDPASAMPAGPIEPGKLWHQVAGDLFLTNMKQPCWGWSDPRTLWLLDFWADFERSTHFVLAYTSPDQMLVNMLESGHCTPALVQSAINSWIRYNTELLRCYHRHGDRCLLVESAAAGTSPGAWLSLLVKKFALPLKETVRGNEQHSQFRDLSLYMAVEMLADQHAAQSLYLELEACADLVAGTVQGKNSSSKAWESLCALLSSHEITENSLLHCHDEIAFLSSQRTKIETDIKAAQEQLQITSEQLAETSDKLKYANLQMHSLKDNTSSLQSENKHLLKTLEELTLRLEEKEGDIHVLRKQLAEARTSQEAARRENKVLQQQRADSTRLLAAFQEAQAALRNASEEKQLVLAQLAQSQENVDSYFLEYQDVMNSNYTLTKQMNQMRSLWKSCQPVEVVIDLRESFDGENWYDAEADGRWAGPATCSVVRLPELRSGNYLLQLDIVDAMDPAILGKLRCELNGVPLPFEAPADERAALVSIPVDTNKISANPLWELKLLFPHLVSPAKVGSSNDNRNLALRIRSIRFLLVQGDDSNH